MFGRVAGFESLGALGSLGFRVLGRRFPGKWCLGLEGLGVLGARVTYGLSFFGFGVLLLLGELLSLCGL